MMEDFIIPINSAIKSFYSHLLANPRTILSSKFGDGKSYFLENFKNTDFVKEQFVFLTIYPVNYQVASNEDIFNLIKRDILFQLMLNNMISNAVVIPKDIALWFYLQITSVLWSQNLYTIWQILLYQVSRWQRLC